MKLHRYIDHDWQVTAINSQVTRIMKLHRNIDHDWQMTPIDFQVTRKKALANSEDPDETPHNAASHLQGLHSVERYRAIMALLFV
ncbi:hypothetical protein DPMN_132130 [Dreissena polymorpha]|uniref:Uncharacterized protein n=1 Tax=Dreissena polymorpha TaxID=45954 RepID=A0A9D4FRX6_DREPO|nr:hypothetical protein DPMN_132130 [Dreissena polymorpha]